MKCLILQFLEMPTPMFTDCWSDDVITAAVVTIAVTPAHFLHVQGGSVVNLHRVHDRHGNHGSGRVHWMGIVIVIVIMMYNWPHHCRLEFRHDRRRVGHPHWHGYRHGHVDRRRTACWRRRWFSPSGCRTSSRGSAAPGRESSWWDRPAPARPCWPRSVTCNLMYFSKQRRHI